MQSRLFNTCIYSLLLLSLYGCSFYVKEDIYVDVDTREVNFDKNPEILHICYSGITSNRRKVTSNAQTICNNRGYRHIYDTDTGYLDGCSVTYPRRINFICYNDANTVKSYYVKKYRADIMADFIKYQDYASLIEGYLFYNNKVD